jgi:hypothetical protein
MPSTCGRSVRLIQSIDNKRDFSARVQTPNNWRDALGFDMSGRRKQIADACRPVKDT